MLEYCYTCKQCGKEVLMMETGELARTCDHVNAPVIANMEAVATGECSMEQG